MVSIAFAAACGRTHLAVAGPFNGPAEPGERLACRAF
jgi:hypothetical protein